MTQFLDPVKNTTKQKSSRQRGEKTMHCSFLSLQFKLRFIYTCKQTNKQKNCNLCCSAPSQLHYVPVPVRLIYPAVNSYVKPGHGRVQTKETFTEGPKLNRENKVELW